MTNPKKHSNFGFDAQRDGRPVDTTMDLQEEPEMIVFV